MAPDLHHAALIQRIIDMGLNPPIDGDTTVSQNGFCLVAADAVQGLHHKVKQLAGLLHLAHDGLVVVARHAVVMLSISHCLLVKYVSQAGEDAALVAVAGLDVLAVVLQHRNGLFLLVVEFLGHIYHDIDEQVASAIAFG